MRVSISTSVLHRNPVFDYSYSVEDAIRICHQSGFQHLDMNFYTQGEEGQPLAQEGWEGWIAEIRALADQLGVQFHQSHAFCYRTVESTDETIDRPWYEERIRRSILASKTLGVEWTVIHPANFSGDEVYSFEKNRKFNLEYWKPFVDLAVKNNIGIAFENMFQSGAHQRYCSDIDELIDLVDSFHDGGVGICWDTGHASLAGQPQGDSIRKLGSRLKATHINDNHALPRQDEHLMPYYGNIDWEEVVGALKDIGYQHDFAFELKKATYTLPPELCGEMLHFLFHLGTNLISGQMERVPERVLSR